MRRALGQRGFVVQPFNSFRAASTSKLRSLSELILLDVDLGDESGIDACSALRDTGFRGGIIMLSGIADTEVKERALRAGADDYVTKPFDIAELTARIDAVRRRCFAAQPSEQAVLELGCVRLVPDDRGAWVDGVFKELTSLEYRLLEALVRRRGAPLGCDDIGREVQGGRRSAGATRNLIHRLRRAIGCRRDLIRDDRDGWVLSPNPRRRASGVQPAAGAPATGGAAAGRRGR